MTPDEWRHWRDTFEACLEERALREAARWIEEHHFDSEARSPATGLDAEQYEQAWSLGASLLDDALEGVWSTLRLVMPKHEDVWTDFELEPTLSDSELEEVEAQYDVELPDAYRQFLRFVGRGAPGIVSIELLDDGTWRWEHPLLEWGPELSDEAADDWLRAHLSEPFPWNDSDSHSVRPQDPLPPGVLTIENRGCLQRDVLIVTGPGAGDVYPMEEGTHEPGYSRPFFEWYRWVVDSYWGH